MYFLPGIEREREREREKEILSRIFSILLVSRDSWE